MNSSTTKNIDDQVQDLLEELNHSVAKQPLQSKEKIRQLGLVITQDQDISQSVIETARDQVGEDDCLSIAISNPGVNKSFKEKLSAGARDDSVIVVNIQSDVSQGVVGMIKKISQDNELNDDSLSSTLDFSNSRIICVVTENQLQDISYPHFVDIFGPVIRL